MTGKIIGTIVLMVVLAMAVSAADRLAYVLNTTGETLSKINLETGSVANNILTVGSDVYCYPNQIVIRDTLAFVVASGTSEIQVINLTEETTAYYIELDASSNPYWFDFVDDQYLYVSFMLTHTIAKVNYLTGETISRNATGKSPGGLLVYGDKLYVACTGFDWGTYQYDPGRVAIYDIPGDSLLRYIDVDLNPQFLALDRLGRVHVVCTGDYFSVFGKINVIDTETDSVVNVINLGGTPGQISIGPDDIAYIAAAGFSMEGYVYSYNSQTGEIFHSASNPIEVDLNCMTVATYQDSTCFTGSFTDYINVIDSSGGYLNSYAVGDGPVHLAFNYIPGDVNGDFDVNLFDATYIIKWLYMDGAKPAHPIWRANVNADRSYDIFDVTYLISFLYKGGANPKVGPAWLM